MISLHVLFDYDVLKKLLRPLLSIFVWFICSKRSKDSEKRFELPYIFSNFSYLVKMSFLSLKDDCCSCFKFLLAIRLNWFYYSIVHLNNFSKKKCVNVKWMQDLKGFISRTNLQWIISQKQAYIPFIVFCYFSSFMICLYMYIHFNLWQYFKMLVILQQTSKHP